MSSVDVQPVILCGGSGTRLWPLSRAGFPKQFLVLTGNESLFQMAARRLAALGSTDIALTAPLIVGNDEHRFMMQEQLREIGVEPVALLLEPAGRNTAPALTLAALAALDTGADPVLVVTPADQTVADTPAFTGALQQAIREAAEGAIAIVGIAPQRPETGYGYIRAGGGQPGMNVERFVEKPDLDTARQYLADGHYYWNAGIFVLRASVWMAALERFRPDIAKAATHAWAGRSTDARFVRPDKAGFAAIPAESVDYAVMERCPGNGVDVRMVPLDAGWSDLGAWDSVWQALPKDAAGNVCFGDTLVSDSRNTLVHAASRLVSVVGLDDVVVVETADAVLVTDRAHSQDVKNIVAALDAGQREEHSTHRKVHRPWGWYDSIDQGPRFKVKRIQVKPKASLSLQKHHHRAEHWVVVSGTAEITCGDKTILLTENQSTYIPLGELHRLANPGKVPLEIIEVQSGAYLGEDDIVRFEDTYGRQGNT
ncbi:MAG: mannose-1-phosphate guanylyltransferase/mannose-6-phosphate isomerase [Rhodocyclaceae bacterium]|nr:mannose-1-phosphate guanylyltransferase/mannose-6-phosphate isomerase [Rhodocyclaceae bacterium]